MSRDDALLSHDETLALLRKVKEGDEDAKRLLCIRNDALVRSIVTVSYTHLRYPAPGHRILPQPLRRPYFYGDDAG